MSDPDCLVDTTVAVALVVAGHEGHQPTLEALEGRLLGLSGHASLGVAGGAVYDALVGQAALAHDLPLATRDHRAIALCRALGVTVDLLA